MNSLYMYRLYSYRATCCGKSRFACLHKKLHPEVHNFLFGVLHLLWFCKLFVQNVRLHDWSNIPVRMSGKNTQGKIICKILISGQMRSKSVNLSRVVPLTTLVLWDGRVSQRLLLLSCAHWPESQPQGRNLHPSNHAFSPNCPSYLANCWEWRLFPGTKKASRTVYHGFSFREMRHHLFPKSVIVSNPKCRLQLKIILNKYTDMGNSISSTQNIIVSLNGEDVIYMLQTYRSFSAQQRSQSHDRQPWETPHC